MRSDSSSIISGEAMLNLEPMTGRIFRVMFALVLALAASSAFAVTPEDLWLEMHTDKDVYAVGDKIYVTAEAKGTRGPSTPITITSSLQGVSSGPATLGKAKLTVVDTTKLSGANITFTASGGGKLVKKTVTIAGVIFTLPAQPVRDLSVVDIAIQSSPAQSQLKNIRFTAKPVNENRQNHLNTQELVFRQKQPADNRQWQIDCAIWYGWRPDNLGYRSVAEYTISVEATVTADGKDFPCRSEPQTLRVKLDVLPSFMNCAKWMVNQRALVKFSTPEFDRVKKVYYVVVTLPPEGVFTRKSEIIVSDRSQYRPLIDKEEAFHKRQWEGKVSRDQGGCGDLFTNNAIEHYMEGAAANYDGKARFEGPDPNTARLNAALGYERARSRAQRESERLRDDRTGYIERKAKEEAGFREAYTYEFTYESLYGTNPTNSLPPWRYDGQ